MPRSPPESQHALVNRRGREAAADNVAAMAEGLSEAQRAAVKYSPWTNRIGLSTPLKTWKALERKGIVYPGRTLFTPLGLAVREHLAAKP